VRDINESDWKHWRQLQAVALDRFCKRVLSEAQCLTSDHATASHQRYLALFRLVQDRDRELGQLFDDVKRSNAMGKLVLLRRAGLLTDEEWDGFSDGIKDAVTKMYPV
jgi:hypothetical protein